MSTEERYAVCERRSDGTVVRLGPVALTASAAQAAYAAELREGVGSPLRLSRATLEAMSRARTRLQQEREERELRAQRECEREHELARWAQTVDW